MGSRRTFIKQAGVLAAGALAGCHLPQSSGKALTDFGIQLYTLRDVFGKDPKGYLAQLAAMGYTQIESYPGPQGIFWGMTATDFSGYIHSLGMKLVASHADVFNNMEKLAADAAAAGMAYLVCPYLGAPKTLAAYHDYAKRFNACGRICRANGLRFAYHNHAYSFSPIDGVVPHTIFMNETDPELVDFEMDMYWIRTAGLDIAATLLENKGRYKLCHVKDKASATEADGDDNNSCTLGTGIIDYAKELKKAEAAGMQYYFVEQERYKGTTSIQCAADNARYMKNLRLV